MIVAMGLVSSSDDEAGATTRAALACLYRSEYGRLVRLAALMLDDRGAAEEVVQEAFVRLSQAWRGLRDERSAPAYLTSTVLNLTRSRLRHRLVARRRAPPSEPDEASAEARALVSEERREVLTALRSLPRRQRECLVLRYYLELSESEIAVALGISAGSVKSHTHRGLAALASRLDPLR